MENTDGEKFDAELVLLADGELHESDLRLYEAKVNIVRPFEILNVALQLRKLDRMGESREIKDMILGNRIERMKNSFDKSVIEIVMEGRMRMSMLLNSHGGFVASGMKRKEYLKYIQSNDGRVEAYLKHAAGPANDLFLNSDERIIVPFSTLAPTQLMQGTPEFVDEINSGMRRSLLKSVDEDKVEQVEDILEKAEEENPENPRPFFNAELMREVGIAGRQAENPDEMRKIFLERTGITLLPESLSDEFELGVQAFFKDE